MEAYVLNVNNEQDCLFSIWAYTVYIIQIYGKTFTQYRKK